VHEDGETLFSWIPKGVIASGKKAVARNFMDVALMPFGSLRFRQVYTSTTSKVEHSTLEEYTLYTELRCTLTSPVMPGLLNGRAVQVDPMKPTLKAPGYKRLKLK